MKKDLFNGNIKHQYISYIWAIIIIVAVIFFGLGGFFLFISFSTDIMADRATGIFVFVLGLASCLYGVFYVGGTIFIIRKYPKYKKYTKWFLNSDYYFVGNDSKEVRGGFPRRYARSSERFFNVVTSIADQNEDLKDIKYPKTYRTYIVFTTISIILSFVYMAITYLVLENMEALPKAFQNEYLVFCAFAIIWISNMIFSFVFAFKVKRIRKETIDEYRGEWRSSLSKSLIDMSDRQNHKKRKYWYEKERLKEIEDVVRATTENAKLNTKEEHGELVSFTVIDIVNERVVFEGFFV